MISVSDVRTFFEMRDVSDEDIQPHLDSAIRDYSGVEWNDPENEKEAVCCAAISNCAPLLWVKIKLRSYEYETIEDFKEMNRFQEYFRKRAVRALERDKSGSSPASISWGAV